jgi:CRP-like cAMP-binding protein
MAADRLDMLARVGVLEGLSQPQLREVAELFGEHVFETGSTIIREGERGARVLAFFIVAEGEAAVTLAGAHVSTLRPGDHFGEMALFSDSPRTATVTVTSKLRCLALSSWEFRSFVEAHPPVAWRLLETMAARMGEIAEHTTEP